MGRLRSFLSVGLAVTIVVTAGLAAGTVPVVTAEPPVEVVPPTTPSGSADVSFRPVLGRGPCVSFVDGGGTPPPGCQAALTTPRGALVVTVDGGRLEGLQLVSPPGLPPLPPRWRFLFGVVSFRVVDLPPGASVTVRFTAPSRVTSYWKLVGGQWVRLQGVRLLGDGLEITLTDGGFGDDDGVVNGIIVDPGALGSPEEAPPPTVPSTVPPSGRLPVTGGDLLVLLWVAGAALMSGTVLVVRRRGAVR